MHGFIGKSSERSMNPGIRGTSAAGRVRHASLRNWIRTISKRSRAMTRKRITKMSYKDFDRFEILQRLEKAIEENSWSEAKIFFMFLRIHHPDDADECLKRLPEDIRRRLQL